MFDRMIFIVLFCFFPIYSHAADSYRVNNSTNSDITEHGNCRNVANASGKDLFIPTKTSAEWTSFYNSPPTGVTVSSCDLCPGVSTIGGVCPNGAKYLGTYNYGGSIGTKKLLITPGGCTNSTTPTCGDTLDTVTKAWKTGGSSLVTGATSTTDGLANTIAIVGTPGDTHPAAVFCSDMTFAGLSDWYLPAQNEWAHITTNMTALGAATFACSSWTSTESTGLAAHYGGDNSGYCGTGTQGKTNSNRVRCILRY